MNNQVLHEYEAIYPACNGIWRTVYGTYTKTTSFETTVILSQQLDTFHIAICHHFILIDHAEEVRGIIQRAAKDVAIESSLKTYEEVWLSKIFEIKAHTGYKRPSSSTAVMAPEVCIGNMI